MAYDTDPDGNGARRIARDPVIGQRESGSPHNAHQQAVRPRVIRKINRSEPRVAGINPRVLPTEQQEHGPQHIRKQGGSKKYRQGSTRRELLGSKTDGEVADEHSEPRTCCGGRSLC